MCGVVGIVNYDGSPVNGAVLAEMADKINHRGPDDQGYMVEKNIGFYHKRLSIIDLKTGHQPMTSDEVTIVFNGEIYNYIELKKSLKQKGHSFRTTSDTEVILRLYIEYGVDAIEKLNGMFAFILFDRPRQRIIVARDHFGIKPLYYYNDENHIIFASEIKALLQHPDIDGHPDHDAIQEYLTFQYVLGENTLFQNIKKLTPGCYKIIDITSRNIKTIKYWDPDFTVDMHHTEDFFMYELRRLLEDAVKIQMRSDVPVGTYLSGGMDSSLVTILASQNYTGGRLKTFTGAFKEGPEFDESHYAKEVTQSCNGKTYLVYPSEEEFISHLPDLIYHMDEPVAGPGLFPQYIVSQCASREVKVVLGGQGGDEIFGGYTRFVIAYLEQALKGAILETHEEGEHIVSLKSILPNLPFIRQYVPMLKKFWSNDVFEPMDRRYFNLIDRYEGDSTLISEDFRKEYNREKIFCNFQKLFNHPNSMSYYNKMVHYDMVSNLPALLQVEDRVSMAVSLESRVPILDRRIVELITSMPPAMKFKGAEMKYILKKAVADLLPESIIKRKDKMGFPVPLHIWSRNQAKPFIKDILMSKACRERGLFCNKAVEQLIESENPFSRKLWGVLCLELWFNQFIDKH